MIKSLKKLPVVLVSCHEKIRVDFFNTFFMVLVHISYMDKLKQFVVVSFLRSPDYENRTQDVLYSYITRF